MPAERHCNRNVVPHCFKLFIADSKQACSMGVLIERYGNWHMTLFCFMALHQTPLDACASISMFSTYHLQEGRGKRHQVLEPSIARKHKRLCVGADSAEAGTNLYCVSVSRCLHAEQVQQHNCLCNSLACLDNITSGLKFSLPMCPNSSFVISCRKER